MALASFGFVLVKRWGSDVEILPLTAWQLVGGGLVLLPVALVVEGGVPRYDAPALVVLAYVGLISTALAYLAWFGGLKHLPAGTTGLIGLLNPVTGVVLGTLLAGEVLEWQQGVGMALVLLGIVLGQPVLQSAWRSLRGGGRGLQARSPLAASGVDEHLHRTAAFEHREGAGRVGEGYGLGDERGGWDDAPGKQ